MLLQLREKIWSKLSKAGVPPEIIAKLNYSDPPKAEMGDVAIGCFPLAAFWKCSPPAAAEKVKALIADKAISAVTVAGPYLNIKLNSAILAASGNSANDSAGRPRRPRTSEQSFPKTTKSQKSVTMVEYCQPNTHKEFHIGHLRNVAYGAALVNIYRAIGRKIIAATYNNDVGSHVAKTLWAYQKFHKNDTPKENKGHWLAHLYVEATRELEDHPEYKDEVSQVLHALETKDKKWHKLWDTTRRWSLDQFHAIYKELGIKFDVSFDEHAVKARGQKIVDALLQRGLAKHSQGAIIMDFEQQNKGVLILRKSDGTGNYATSDLALAEEKFKRYKIAESVVITDSRQALYFWQLFQTLGAYGFKNKLRHLGYELVALPEGKMASRKGNVILYETLRNEVVEHALAETQKRHATWPAKKIRATAQALAIGAIRFSMIKQSPLKVIVFDKNEALSFEGYTSPYLQYTCSRIQSVFKKAGRAAASKPPATYKWNDTEHALWLKIAKYELALAHAATTDDPSELARYLFELCQDFSGYYEKFHVLENDTKVRAARLALLQKISQTLTTGLTLLGVPVIKEM